MRIDLVPRQQLDQPGTGNVVIDVEEILVFPAAHEIHAGTGKGRFANPVRKNRRFLADIGANHDNRIVLLDISDVATEPREWRIILLVRKVPALNPVIEVRGSKVLRKPRQQVTLFNGRTRRGDQTELVRIPERIGGKLKRIFPSKIAPLAAFPDTRLHKTIR